MAVIDFPSSPSIGQIYTQNSLSWIWTGITWDSYSNSPTTPVHIIYNTIAELLADQSNQFQGFLYYVLENETYYNYLGTTNEDVNLDYSVVGGLGVINDNINNEVLVIYVNPDNLSGIGTIEEQICEYINSNVEINYSRQYSKLNIILGEEPNIPVVIQKTIIHGFLYNSYVAVDERNITSSDDWIVPNPYVEYDALATYLGGYLVAGGKLKDTDFSYWESPNIDATNEAGFNARGSGYRFGGFTGLNTSHVSGVEPTFLNGEFLISNSTGQAFTGSGFGARLGKSIRLLKTSTTLSHGETGTYTGNDGQVYQTICIGTQEWLAENLIETKYRNGDDIPEVTDETEWGLINYGARCSYDNDESNAFIIP